MAGMLRLAVAVMVAGTGIATAPVRVGRFQQSRALLVRVEKDKGCKAEESFNERRRALVIGVSQYSHINSLLHPTGDAVAVAAALCGDGFNSTLLLDPTDSQLDSAIVAFGTPDRDTSVRLFYYAGHAVQHLDDNYLLPANTEVQVAADLPNKAYSLQVVMSALTRSRSLMNIVILDACRDDPLQQDRRLVPLQATRGLVKIRPPRGTLVLYSADPGQRAFDGEPTDPHSPFTTLLLKWLDRPGVEVSEAFKGVQQDVPIRSDFGSPWFERNVNPNYPNFFFRPRSTSRVVRSFSFMYSFGDFRGMRYWRSNEIGDWIETYPFGLGTNFKWTSTEDVDGNHGTVVTRDDGTLQVFIPDKNSALMWVRFRQIENRKWSEWRYLGQMLDIR